MLNIFVGMLFGILFLSLTVYYVVTLGRLTYLVIEIAYTGIKQSLASKTVPLKDSLLNTQ